MKLKCIGGLNDGEWHEIENDRRIGERVRVAEKQEFKVINSKYIEDIYKESKEAMTLKYNIYRIEVLRCKNFNNADAVDMKILIPHDWHIWEAILHQFSK
jgi:hypothetical protein